MPNEIVTIARPILIPFATFGILANVFLFSSIFFDRKKKSLLSVMISAQACADFLLNISYLWASSGMGPNHVVSCHAQGFALTFTFQGTLLHWWVISVVRRRFVIENRETTRFCYFLFFTFCWGASLTYALFITLSHNLEIGPAGFYCAPNWDVSYVSIIACVSVFLFNLHLVWNYASIYYYVRTNAREEHISTTRMLIVVIIFFECSVLPFWMYLVIRVFHINPAIINFAYCETIVFSLVEFNTALNPVLVSALSPWVRVKQKLFLDFISCHFLTKTLGMRITDDQDNDYDHSPQRPVTNIQTLSQHTPHLGVLGGREFSDRHSQLNERTLSSSQSLHALAAAGETRIGGEEDEDGNSQVTRVHGGIGSPFPSPSHTQTPTNTITPSLPFREQMFDLRIDAAKVSDGDGGSEKETRSPTPTSSVFDEKEHQEGV